MTYAELEAHARKLTPAKRDAALRSLAADTRFAAVVRLLEEQRESIIDIVRHPQASAQHGTIEHAAGALDQACRLQDALRDLLNETPKPRRRPSGPPADDE